MAAPVPTEWVGVSAGGRAFVAVSCTMGSVAFVCVALRVWSRLRTYRRLFIDDHFSILSQLVFFVLMALSVVFATSCGIGWHVKDVPPLQVERFFIVFYVAEIVFSLVSPFYKLAVLFLYRRIFGHITAFSIATWVMVALTVGWGISVIGVIVFQCNPVQRAWDAALPGQCIHQLTFILGNGIANLLIDAMILVLPVPVVWNLQLTTTKKIGLTGMFFLGALICVAGAIRVSIIATVNLSDPTYNLVNLAIWSEIEPAAGIISACLPTLRQFIWSRGGSNAYGSHGYSSKARRSSSKRNGLDSTAKSNMSVALTAWNDHMTNTDIYGGGDPEFALPLHGDGVSSTVAYSNGSFPRKLSDEEEDRAVFVTTEVSVSQQ